MTGRKVELKVSKFSPSEPSAVVENFYNSRIWHIPFGVNVTEDPTECLRSLYDAVKEAFGEDMVEAAKTVISNGGTLLVRSTCFRETAELVVTIHKT